MLVRGRGHVPAPFLTFPFSYPPAGGPSDALTCVLACLATDRNLADRFVFETPYTVGGKNQGTVEDQRKRLTVLTTEQSFPSMRRRLAVIKHEQVLFYKIKNIEV